MLELVIDVFILLLIELFRKDDGCVDTNAVFVPFFHDVQEHTGECQYNHTDFDMF